MKIKAKDLTRIPQRTLEEVMNTTPEWVMSVPVISTAHVTQEEAAKLDANQSVFRAKYDYGWFVYMDEIYGDTSTCLADITRWAGSKGYEWVRLDCDGDEVEGLPVYHW